MVEMPLDTGGHAERSVPDVQYASCDPHTELSAVAQNIMRRLNVSGHVLPTLIAASKNNGTTFQQELLAGSLVDEERYFEAMAKEFGIAYQSELKPDRLLPFRGGRLEGVLGFKAARRLVLYRDVDGQIAYLVSPDVAEAENLFEFIRKYPRIAERLRIVSAAQTRQAVMKSVSDRLLEKANTKLFSMRPWFSARHVTNAWQGMMLGMLVVGLPVALWVAFETTLLAIHLVASLFFFACVNLRLFALRVAKTRRPEVSSPEIKSDLPVYTVLVALYREANVVSDLLVALGRLRWPRSKLEIKLICEADDHETISALRAHKLSGAVEIVIVPPGTPRTKPKALTYALPVTSGELVALYDAEDRPHPDQLLEAWQRFKDTDENMACLQAPIFITNWNTNMLTRMFAFEYAALFRGIVPWLASKRLFVPLGGTSNHFRRSALETMLGWDPYNVTEDADLGLRLVRHGYRVGVIDCPTLEDAPDEVGVWFRQRTRWFKGWILCWFVHNRNPFDMLRDCGAGSFVAAQVLLAGIFASSLLHPIIIVSFISVIAKYLIFGELNGFEKWLLIIDTWNMGTAYLAFYLLGRRALSPYEKRGSHNILGTIPVYWLMQSLAAWRAVWQLYWKPHLWEKTPHKRHRNGPASLTGRKTPFPRQ